jgi:hypothetical protein
MPADTPEASSHAHTHAHAHAHAHAQHQDHAQVPDLKSPVLIGLTQRLGWIALLLLALWLIVFWALRTNG